MPMPMMMMMIPSSSTFVDVHTDARRSTSSTSSRRSSSRRASFVRRPSSPTTAGIHSRTESHVASITTPVGRRAVPGVRRRKKGGARTLHTLGRMVPICPSASLRFIRTHPHPIRYQCVSHRSTSTKKTRDARADDPTTRTRWMPATTARARREDDEKRRRATRRTGDRPCREGYRTGYSPCSRWVRETTRRDGRVMDGWMRDARDARWMDDANSVEMRTTTDGWKERGGRDDRVGGVSTRVGREDGE